MLKIINKSSQKQESGGIGAVAPCQNIRKIKEIAK